MKKIIIKLGTSSLTNGTKQLFLPHMAEMARQIAELHQAGHQVILVCSGAIAAGREVLSSKVDQSLSSKQMLASIGQVRLMRTWTKLFEIYSILIGQVLLTRGDVTNEKSYQNAQNTFYSLLNHCILPIVNENDTVATEEITLGDNDNLSSLVAELISADLLILLTDQNGVYTADPRLDPKAELIQHIDYIDETIRSLAKDSSHPEGLGRGGMSTKIEAARFATEHGIATIIASAKIPNVILEIASGKPIGTYFSKQCVSQKNYCN
jgi:glutamate 5-kinase